MYVHALNANKTAVRKRAQGNHTTTREPDNCARTFGVRTGTNVTISAAASATSEYSSSMLMSVVLRMNREN